MFKFAYDATQGNKNVKLVKVTDPRGNATNLAYYAPQTGDDPKYHWWTKTITDRLQRHHRLRLRGRTPANTKFTDTTVTDAENHATELRDGRLRPAGPDDQRQEPDHQDALGRGQQRHLPGGGQRRQDRVLLRPEDRLPALAARRREQQGGRPADHDCAPGTYPANATSSSTRPAGRLLAPTCHARPRPEGRKWQFGYDAFGNLKTVTDPKGVATATAGDYTTTYTYDAYGQLTKATDANGNTDHLQRLRPDRLPGDHHRRAEQVDDVRLRRARQGHRGHRRAGQEDHADVRHLRPSAGRDGAEGPGRGRLHHHPGAGLRRQRQRHHGRPRPNGAVSTAVYDNADQVDLGDRAEGHDHRSASGRRPTPTTRSAT